VTCIVGLEQGKRVYLMGDSAIVTNESTVESARDGKLFRRGAFAVGWAGDVGFCEALRALDWPARAPRSPRRWLAGTLIPQLAALKSDGAALIACGAALYYADTDGALYRPAVGYGACGAGAEAALAALAALGELVPNPWDRLRRVLGAVEKHTTHARAPFRRLAT
jgi:hypothetical protein